MTQSHSRSKRVLPRHIIATLAISGASVAGMAAPSFAEEPAPPADGTTAAAPEANETVAATLNTAVAQAKLANLPQANGDTPPDGGEKRTPPDNDGNDGQGDNGNGGENGQGDNGNGGDNDSPDPTPSTETPSPTPSSPSGDPTSPSPTNPGQSPSGNPSPQDPKNPGDPSQRDKDDPGNKVPGLNTGTPSNNGAENGGDHGIAPGGQQDPGASVPVVPSPRAGSGQNGASGAQLPRTGASVTNLAAIAVAAAGTGGILVARRRRAY